MNVQTSISSAALGGRYRDIYEQRMQGLPFINTELSVEAIGFRQFENFEIGVLITPWFMNLTLLPGTDIDANINQGRKINVIFPGGEIEFTTAQDDELGLYFSAVLFSSVENIPDQATARELALEVMNELFSSESKPGTLSRRSLFTAAVNSDA
jgi:[NiFe] hydrogenase assembly HybE family chaperone